MDPIENWYDGGSVWQGLEDGPFLCNALRLFALQCFTEAFGFSVT